MTPCYCGSGLSFESCCEPFLLGDQSPETAEQLMRSRYSAYVEADVRYILKTTHPSKRKYYSAASIKKWATSSKWIKLEVIATENGSATDDKGTVTFKAYYSNEENLPLVHHEHSYFIKEKGIWFFLEGEVKEE
jgi:SEC-C motif-containing protein